MDELLEISENMEYFDQDYESAIKADYYLQMKVENRQQLCDRVRRVLQHTLDAHKIDCNILIVTHAATLLECAGVLLTMNEK